MNRLKLTICLALGYLVAATLGCEDTTQPTPPPDPPQISFERYSVGAGDAKHRLVDNEVYDVFVDSRKRIWFATDQGVCMRDSVNNIVVFDDFDGIPNRLCRAFAELNGRVYVGTWGNGAAVYNDTTWTALPVRNGSDPGLIDGKVSAAVSDGSTVWFGTADGVSQYRDTPGLTETQRWINHTSKMGTSRLVSRMLFQNTGGNQVWVATKDWGITVIRPSSSTRYTVATTDLPEDDVSGLAFSSADTTFWVGLATQCVASVDVGESVWTHFTDVNGFGSNLATGVAVRQKGGVELWLGVQTGLCLAKNGKVTNYIAGSGLPAERVRNVVTDRNGDVWACFIGAGAAKITSYEIP